jgi:hypothetical protein
LTGGSKLLKSGDGGVNTELFTGVDNDEEEPDFDT